MTHVLKSWLLSNKISGSEFCRQIGIHRSMLTYIFQGKRSPSKALCLKIYEFTNGEIDPIDLLKMQQTARIRVRTDAKHMENKKKQKENTTTKKVI
jgi:transcriptional regulator with XRE-family HTH domain